MAKKSKTAMKARLKALRKKHHLGEFAPKGSNPFKRKHRKHKRR